MNYRHAYHAGNFADLLKHAVLGALLHALRRLDQPLTIIDTHAGAGMYDLMGEAARRTGEAQAGVGRLMPASDAPSVFDDLKAAVQRANRGGGMRYYPGSPVLIAWAARSRDRLFAFEMLGDDAAVLAALLASHTGAVIIEGDGWALSAQRVPPPPNPVLVLIDPPYEAADDAAQVIRLTGRLLRRNQQAVVAIWAPIKDLTGFDDMLGELEEAVGDAPVLVVEARLRPLHDPMKLNGCAMLVVNAPPEVDDPALQAARWVAAALGEAGALGRVSRLGGQGQN